MIDIMQVTELKNFDYLDTYRGLCAVSVIIGHSNGFLGEFKIISPFYFGVVNFFLLSSFLLTYRLIIQFENAALNRASILQTIINYFISRFFRIYVPVWAYLLLCYPIEIYILKRTVYLDISVENMVIMDKDHFTGLYGHLWTIPVEVF